MSAVKNFRSNLRLVCEERQISQRSLAERAGVAFPTVNRILQGHNDPSIGTCEKLAEAIEIPLELLILHPVDFRVSLEKISA